MVCLVLCVSVFFLCVMCCVQLDCSTAPANCNGTYNRQVNRRATALRRRATTTSHLSLSLYLSLCHTRVCAYACVVWVQACAAGLSTQANTCGACLPSQRTPSLSMRC